MGERTPHRIDSTANAKHRTPSLLVAKVKRGVTEGDRCSSHTAGASLATPMCDLMSSAASCCSDGTAASSASVIGAVIGVYEKLMIAPKVQIRERLHISIILSKDSVDAVHSFMV